jgi:hypothetical protein
MAIAKGSQRVALTLPSNLVASLSYVALRMGVSKSDLVASLLAQPVDAMRAALFAFPDPLDRLGSGDKAQLFATLRGLIATAVTELSDGSDSEVGNG